MPLQDTPRTCSECAAPLIPTKSAKGLCQRCYNRAYHAAHQEDRRIYDELNREKHALYMREWRRAHLDHRRKYKQRYRIEHYDQERKRERADYAKHREVRVFAMRMYRSANLEEYRAKGRRYAAQHRTQASTRARAWHQEHRQYARDAQADRRAKLRKAFVAPVSLRAIFDRDRGICQICKKPCTWEDATRDHIWPLAAKDGLARHEPRFVQLAHRSCNCSRKHLGPAQTRLW